MRTVDVTGWLLIIAVLLATLGWIGYSFRHIRLSDPDNPRGRPPEDTWTM